MQSCRELLLLLLLAFLCTPFIQRVNVNNARRSYASLCEKRVFQGRTANEKQIKTILHHIRLFKNSNVASYRTKLNSNIKRLMATFVVKCISLHERTVGV